MRLFVLATLLLAMAPADAVDVVLGGKPVAAREKSPAAATRWSSCAPRAALQAGTKLGAPAAPSLSMTSVSAPHRSPARGRVESLAYPRITEARTAQYGYVAPGTAVTANPCAWKGATVR